MAPSPALPGGPAPAAHAGSLNSLRCSWGHRVVAVRALLSTGSTLYSSVLQSARSGADPVQLVSVTAVSGESEEVNIQQRINSQSEATSSGRNGYLDFPARDPSGQQPRKDPPMVRVKLSVHYRVHSRQMLCIGGSQIPFGWSFLSIAKVPMIWTEGDLWTAEVLMPANSRIEYKYVILEEQDWTKQESEDAEGVVTFSYRTQPDSPPDIQTIQKQMAIVAWQPGPNRVVQVPSEEEFNSLREGEVRERMPARAPTRAPAPRRFGNTGFVQRATNVLLGGLNQQPPPRGPGAPGPIDGAAPAPPPGGADGPPGDAPPGEAAPTKLGAARVSSPFPDGDELAGTWEALLRDAASGEPLLERRDVWGFTDAGGDPLINRGVRFG